MPTTQHEIDLSTLLQGSRILVDNDADVCTATLLLDCHNILGEGVVYDDRSDCVLWTDILGKQFHKLELTGNNSHATVQHTIYDLPKMLGSFGLLATESAVAGTAEGRSLLCAFDDGFQLYDVERGIALSEYSQGEAVNPQGGTSRLNDGRVDPTGRFFVCGGFFGDMKDVTMKVFRVQQNTQDLSLSHVPLLEGVQVSNCICWSKDGKHMHFADSPTKTIHRYDYDGETGTISNTSILHEKVDVGVPDGCTVDAEGYLWNAVWRAGKAPGAVQRIDPLTGKVVFTVHMPDKTSQVTCCCFGGKDLDILFITTASENRDRAVEPHAGGLYAVKLPFRGRKESRLQFKY